MADLILLPDRDPMFAIRISYGFLMNSMEISIQKIIICPACSVRQPDIGATRVAL
jgi:hypothetical protein